MQYLAAYTEWTGAGTLNGQARLVSLCARAGAECISWFEILRLRSLMTTQEVDEHRAVPRRCRNFDKL